MRFLERVERFDALVQKLYDLIPLAHLTDQGQMLGRAKHGNLSSRNGGSSWHFDVQGFLAEMKTHLDNETQKELRDWLDTHDSKSMYEAFVRKRLDGTCGWILGRSEFLQWHSSVSENTAPLWVHGPPGYGETIICARMTQYMLENSEAPLAYFFFSSKLESREDPFVVMRSWISQVVMQNQQAFDLAREKKEMTNGRIASQAEVEELFASITLSIPKCIFIVDGLDEYAMREYNGKASHKASLLEFLSSLRHIVSISTSRLLVVSRNDGEIRQGLGGDKNNKTWDLVEIQIQPKDVESDATSLSESIVEKRLPNKSEAQRRELTHRIVDQCQSMFLGIRLLEPDLNGGKNLKQLQRLIDDAPSRLDHVYDRNWKKIDSLEDASRCRAFAILRWATFAARPFTILELTDVLLLANDECDTLDYTELPDAIDEVYVQTEILELCGSLIEVRQVEQSSGLGYSTVHLSHFTVREYVLRHMLILPRNMATSEDFQSANEAVQNNILAETCIRYLNSEEAWGKKQQYGANDTMIQAFRKYAAT
ncbi:hypothetical protein F5Y18DRAFT_93792 [Xylariaceae sp. FL1019]|nr:hypothetical protein F5Y18DRAFT_93792 [Xylariaceae sp. FL1019]